MEQLHILGASAVFPFASKVAEKFASESYPIPIVESTGTGGAISIGSGDPLGVDVIMAARRLNEGEKSALQENGFEAIEIPVGRIGFVFTHTGLVQGLSGDQIARAMLAQIPDDAGSLVSNDNATWSDIAPSLPDTKIEIFIPPPTSGARDILRDFLKGLGYENTDLRSDGGVIESGENDYLTVQRLQNDPTAVGLIPFGHLVENSAWLEAIDVDGVEAAPGSISDGQYSLSSTAHIYVRRDALDEDNGLAAYVAEFLSEAASGDRGYLMELGWVPLNDDQRQDVRDSLDWLPGVSDVSTSTAGDDRLYPTDASHSLDGMGGLDTVVYALERAEFSISLATGGELVVDKPGGTDTLISIERIEFNDGTLAFDLDGANLGFTYRIYAAGYGRTPDEGGLRFWVDVMDRLERDQGTVDRQDFLAREFLIAPEFTELYGSAPTSEAYIDAMYLNVLDRLPDQEGYDFWVDAMEDGLDRADILVYFAESPENVARTAPDLTDGVWVM